MLTTLFSSELFMPHGHCYLWQPGLVWLQVLSNTAIAAAYVAIFITLIYLVRRIRDIPFQWMYVAFAVFIVACGVTHVFDVYVIWHPAYWLDGAVRVVTAVASVGTALMLPPLVPKAIELAESVQVAHDRGLKLEEANRELAVLLDKTKELEELKTEFFANVSHELRTPLTLILGPVQELLSADNLTGGQLRHLEVVSRNARALLGQVNDLLDVAKLEAGKLGPDYMEVDLAALVRLTAVNFDSLAAERHVVYQIHTPEAARAQVDPDKLQRVLLNLLSNAFKFTPEGGRIECEMHVDAATGVAVVEVTDNGPGIRSEHRAVVFERFKQLEGGTTRRFGGTGLGLAIAKEFVELHGGQISVTDAVGGGSRFRVEVPLEAPKGAAVRPALFGLETFARRVLPTRPPAAVEAPHPVVPDDRPLVLIVEDNAELNRFLAESLAKEHRVATANNGVDGLRLARELHPAAIVTDLMMPQMGGDELLRAARADAQLCDIPIVVLTAKADDAQRLQLLRDGAQDYLLKPFSPEELRVRVNNMVSMKRARDLLRAELESKTDNLEDLAQEVAVRQKELKTVAESLRVARDQALSASEVKTNFLSMVSHELRTPLTVQRLQIDRLLRELPHGGTDKQSQVLMRLDRSSTRLEQLLTSLLDYARIQSGRLTLDVQATDLVSLVQTAVDEMQPQADAKQLTLEVILATQVLPLTMTDPQLVHLIVINLLANAIKFTERGKVTVRLELDGERRRISVSDTGPGIPLHEQARMFEAFERLELVRHKHAPGVGLGLAIVREMAAALGGEVSLQSEAGQGSTFMVSIPGAIS